jgi:hypothetical protein
MPAMAGEVKWGATALLVCVLTLQGKPECG